MDQIIIIAVVYMVGFITGIYFATQINKKL